MSNVFDRKAAANYAMAWALMYNPEWPIVQGSDCTNFISQALHAGGWPMIDNGRAPSDHCSWYCYGSARSYSWGGAQPFASYLQASARGAKCQKSELELGDIVQLLDQSGSAHHSMIVTMIDPETSEYYLSYHTKHVLNKPLSAIAPQDYDGITYWKIKDHIPKPPSLSRQEASLRWKRGQF
ncbi:amidase domain-containing protein [Bradyrhizobium sp. STM 3557]|uniref:amidase domain-containing protein n=1 Tax=Bradyrhizobium sp. STM 3557 TaxID=578920 RepID=UPI00388EC2BB